MTTEYRGYSIRKVTGMLTKYFPHENGSATFIPYVDRWYPIGDTDDGLVFLGDEAGYATAGLAGQALLTREGPPEPRRPDSP